MADSDVKTRVLRLTRSGLRFRRFGRSERSPRSCKVTCPRGVSGFRSPPPRWWWSSGRRGRRGGRGVRTRPGLVAIAGCTGSGRGIATERFGGFGDALPGPWRQGPGNCPDHLSEVPRRPGSNSRSASARSASGVVPTVSDVPPLSELPPPADPVELSGWVPSPDDPSTARESTPSSRSAMASSMVGPNPTDPPDGHRDALQRVQTTRRLTCVHGSQVQDGVAEGQDQQVAELHRRSIGADQCLVFRHRLVGGYSFSRLQGPVHPVGGCLRSRGVGSLDDHLLEFAVIIGVVGHRSSSPPGSARCHCSKQARTVASRGTRGRDPESSAASGSRGLSG